LGNLRHWLQDEMEELIRKIPHIHREEICRK
jgi:hypothetical protein